MTTDVLANEAGANQGDCRQAAWVGDQGQPQRGKEVAVSQAICNVKRRWLGAAA